MKTGFVFLLLYIYDSGGISEGADEALLKQSVEGLFALLDELSIN